MKKEILLVVVAAGLGAGSSILVNGKTTANLMTQVAELRSLVEKQSQLNADTNAQLKSEVISSIETAKLQTVSVDKEQFKQEIMANPETIIKSLSKFRFEQEQIQRQAKNKQLKELRPVLFDDKNDPFIGNPNGKHVVVEFIDYNCGYCKALSPTLAEFVKADPEAKVIIKEFPIFDNVPSSRYAAEMGLALFYLNPDLYGEFHEKLMSIKQLDNQKIESVLASLNIESNALKEQLPKVEKQINAVRQLAMQLDVEGTPTVFAKDQRLSGGVTVSELHQIFKN
ncbi:DsbA family protein [Photobacterium leiognathi]|uniref:DsbA family protein n=1 Tax=Photobacterium leiognathi TaxID=553611 RepID=UPI002981A637|nr:DsbA family protein [Photobacterium leiognathi]